MNTRDPRNISINATLRQARSVVMESLAPEYKRVGIVLPPGASKVRFLPEPTYLAPKEMDDAGFLVEWEKLRETNVPLYRVLGLARFAGMRKSEILAMRGKWLVEGRQGWCVEVRDRPEENWYHKTGRRYLAVVLDAGLLAQLRTVGPDDFVVDVVDRINWARDVPQKWMKPFTTARKPLHRLRGVYADQVAELTETAVLARAQGVQAASEALGHTGTAVTQKHYLTEKL